MRSYGGLEVRIFRKFGEWKIENWIILTAWLQAQSDLMYLFWNLELEIRERSSDEYSDPSNLFKNLRENTFSCRL